MGNYTEQNANVKDGTLSQVTKNKPPVTATTGRQMTHNESLAGFSSKWQIDLADSPEFHHEPAGSNQAPPQQNEPWHRTPEDH